MPHQEIPDDDAYHEGDSRDIRLTVYQNNVGGRRQNLRNAEIEWLVKEDQKDPDSEALLTKSTSDDSVEILDARNGESVIHIYEDDTEGFLTEEGPEGEEIRLDEKTFHHRARVRDQHGNRVTVCHGEWTIYK